jgi:CheY-like chemotaxis protein
VPGFGGAPPLPHTVELPDAGLAAVRRFAPGAPSGIEMSIEPKPADGNRAIVAWMCTFAGLHPPRSVLICDDRPAVRHSLAELLRPLPSLLQTRCVADGFAVVDAMAVDGVDLVLIGIHTASHIGHEAVELVLGIHPSTVIVVVGSAGDIDLLAPAYVRGARGMLLWEVPAHPGTDSTQG